MTDEIEMRLNHLEAWLAGTQAALRALIAAQPDPVRAVRLVAAAVEEYTATALAAPQPEAFVDALAKIDIFVLPSERDLARR